MAIMDGMRSKYWASLDRHCGELEGSLGGALADEPGALDRLCALLHKIKGEAQLLGLATCAELIEKMESVAKLRRDVGMREVDAEPIRAGLASLREMSASAGTSESLEDALLALMLHGRALRAGTEAR